MTYKKLKFASAGSVKELMLEIFLKPLNIIFPVLSIELEGPLTLKKFIPCSLIKNIGLFGSRLQELKAFSGWLTTLDMNF